MKSKRIPLLKWSDTDQTLDIDWPRLHQRLGLDIVRWLNQQKPIDCQLMLEKLDCQFQLTAEFYHDRCYQEFLRLREKVSHKPRSGAVANDF